MQTEHRHIANDSKASSVIAAEPNKENPVTVSQLWQEFHRAYQDITRRKHNIVV